MICIPNEKSIIQKIVEYRHDYIREHGKPPTVIWLDPDEREDLRRACQVLVWQYPVMIMGMTMKHQEDKP